MLSVYYLSMEIGERVKAFRCVKEGMQKFKEGTLQKKNYIEKLQCCEVLFFKTSHDIRQNFENTKLYV